MSDPTDAPIFIVGTPRSGTTLAAKILGRHPRLFMPGETHFFDDIHSHAKADGTFGEEDRQGIRDRLATLYGRYNEPTDQERIDHLLGQGCDFQAAAWTSYRDALTAFMRAQMEHEGKVRWGNNAPRDIFHVKTIVRFYPDAKVVVCVRDPRDFLVSYKGKWRSTAEDEVERLRSLYHPLVTSLLWKSSMKLVPSIRERVPEGNLFILPYETMVADPEGTVRRLCETIGEEYDPAMLDVDTYGSAHGDQGRGVFSSSVGRWREHLSDEECWIAQRTCAAEMQALGYAPEPVRPSRLKVLAIKAAAPAALVRALHANRHKRGPLLPYLLKRAGALLGGKR